ncbi:MAG TPA: ArsI/CadI family heavy metal resistance metalloenzyme [Alphaproteobacteria bacterium]|jgi:catechol 2,3-dioxygenase-like lactoylglutathione lyase family enzyme|nr:ArsI/CadI family heavy metal resistance metalloenzyme [Alphaproteobacteria bacterium]
MKRLHVHVGVDNIDASVKFYSTLFAAEPTVLKPDYAKWMLDDPRVNFAISARGRATGLDHLGIQVESDGELRDIAGRLRAADRVVVEQTKAACCYANSDKAWVADPQGVAWETFLTHGDATVYGDDSVETDKLTRAERPDAAPLSAACCDRPATRAVS